MIPGAIDADLDDVARELFVVRNQLRQPLGRINDAAVIPFEVLSINVTNRFQRFVGAHRALLREVLPDVLGGAKELGMGVANVRRIEAALS